MSAGGTGATTANAALVAEEERMLRRYLTAAVSDSMAMSALTSTQTASLLYRSGHKRAAKELLCEQRQIYAEFQRTPWPCSPRTEAELRRIDRRRRRQRTRRRRSSRTTSAAGPIA